MDFYPKKVTWKCSHKLSRFDEKKTEITVVKYNFPSREL